MRWRNKTNEQRSTSDVDAHAPFADMTNDPDQLSGEQLAVIDHELEAGLTIEGTRDLATLVEPPDNLRSRLKTRVDRRRLGQKTVLTCADLVGTAWRTVMEIFGPTRRP